MTLSAVRRALVALALLLSPIVAGAQAWRRSAAGIGNTARVLLVGAHPEDEDNALIAWLSLGRHIETAYLSLTRGESGRNVSGNEQQSALAVVRTAELLAERQRDGAHQYFTRAYDFGTAPSDSVIDVLWPHDSLLNDVVSVIRAFRPQVVVALFADSTDANPAHRAAARLAREAFALAGDTIRLPSGKTSHLPGWTPSRLFTRVDSAASGGPFASVDVGEFDRATGSSYAEIGAEIRRLQRTQPPPVAPPVGHVWRVLRLDSEPAGSGATDFFGAVDTAWSRFGAAGPSDARGPLDSLGRALGEVHRLAAAAPADSLAIALARAARHALDARAALSCSDESGVPRCPGVLGDLAVSLTNIRERATRALLGAAGVVVDATVAREVVAAGFSVPVSVAVFNGGALPVTIRGLQVTSRSAWSTLMRDSIVIRPDSVARWTGHLGVNLASLHWWQIHGLVYGTAIHDFNNRSVIGELIGGEDRIPTSAVEARMVVAGVEVPLSEGPLVYRDSGALRGDERHPLAGVPPLSVLLERAAEYERANLPMDRLFRVLISSARSTIDTVTVTVKPPRGVRADSASRVIVVPPFSERSVFFRLRGMLQPGRDSIVGLARLGAAAASRPAQAPQSFAIREFHLGVFSRDYPHIPTQQYFREPSVRLQAVDLQVPPRLRVAYVRGTDDVQTPLGQLQINLQTIEPSLLSVVDLSVFSTVLIGANAMANDALAGAVPSLRAFMRNGGTVVVLPGGEEVAASGLLPYPIGFDSIVRDVSDPAAPVRAIERTGALLRWPNAITQADFEGWIGERARHVPATFDARYRTVLSTGDPGGPSTAATILAAPAGTGMIVYTTLSLDRQLAAVNPGAARLLVNLLSAGLAPKGR